jgi:hypothetical protein
MRETLKFSEHLIPICDGLEEGSWFDAKTPRLFNIWQACLQ